MAKKYAFKERLAFFEQELFSRNSGRGVYPLPEEKKHSLLPIFLNNREVISKTPPLFLFRKKNTG